MFIRFIGILTLTGLWLLFFIVLSIDTNGDQDED